MAKQTVQFRAPGFLVERIDREAKKADRTRSEYICRLLERLAEVAGKDPMTDAVAK